MAEVIRWLFTFSSPFHLIWFLLSMTWLVVALTGPRTLWPRLYGCIGHSVVAMNAGAHLWLVGGGPVYSVHCIWFNALMGVIYWSLIKRAAMRPPPD